jgi:hypothetical protein
VFFVQYLMAQGVPLYLSEMAPAHLRGGLNMMFQLATTLGIFTANLINYGTQNIKPWGWRLSLGLASVLERIRGTADVGAEFTDMVEASERAGQHHRAPVPEHPGAAEPAAAGDGRVHAGVPDPDGHQLHPLLRARAVPEHGVRQ